MYIHRASSISYVTDLEGNFPSELDVNATRPDELNTPVYKEIIKPNLIRRMSPVVRMGVACATRCIDEKEFDGVIVGTGLGCIKDTQKFLDNFVKTDEGILSPTAFIQSTHNTIAGQIALIFKNHGYNMTHVQNGLSFETTLMDAKSQLDIGEANRFIIGGLDEKTPFLEDLASQLSLDEVAKDLGEGASFFNVSSNKENAIARVKDVAGIWSNKESVDNQIDSILTRNNSSRENTTILGFNNSVDSFKEKQLHNTTNLTGKYYTNSAFGLHLACSILEGKTKLNEIESKENILVVNKFRNTELGLILVSKP